MVMHRTTRTSSSQMRIAIATDHDFTAAHATSIRRTDNVVRHAVTCTTTATETLSPRCVRTNLTNDSQMLT
jgi:hypothetical protein